MYTETPFGTEERLKADNLTLFRLIRLIRLLRLVKLLQVLRKFRSSVGFIRLC